jgi:tRNA A-37 threonylcarbamoyl transferase component Bud32
MANNRDFKRTRGEAGVICAVRDLPDAACNAILHNPKRLLRDSIHRPLKIGPISLIVRGVLPLDGGPIEIVYKRARPRNWLKALADRFRRGRATRAWYLGHALLSRGIPTARPLLACEPRHPRFWRESYLATQWIDGAEDLHRWGRRVAAQPETQRLRLAAHCAETLGRLLGRMHAQQISHRDLKGNNVLIVEGDGEMWPWLIDLDGVRIHRRISAARRAADLARLATSAEAHPWITRTIRYRFLRVYAEQFPRGAVECRSLWRAIAARTGRLIRRKRREGKPLW